MTAPKPRGGARPGAGRPPGKARSGLRRTLLLSHEAIAVLDAVPERQRGAWVSALIEGSSRAPFSTEGVALTPESTRAVDGRHSSRVR